MKTNAFNLVSAALIILLFINVIKTEAQITIGKNEVSAGGALLELKEYDERSDKSTATKGIIYPRVALTDPNELYPMYSPSSREYQDHKSELKERHIGLTVYNVGESNGFIPGIHVWDGENWVRPVTEIPEVEANAVNSIDLKTEYIPEILTGPDKNTSSMGGGTVDMEFFKPIIIPEEGSYAFCFRLYGEMPESNVNKTGVYYLSIWRNNSAFNKNLLVQPLLKDIAEIAIYVVASKNSSGIPIPGMAYVYTYSITMGGYFHKGDEVKVKMTGFPEYPVRWKLIAHPTTAGSAISAERTSVIWWRL